MVLIERNILLVILACHDLDFPSVQGLVCYKSMDQFIQQQKKNRRKETVKHKVKGSVEV
jgi:hypothetical protein